MSLKTDAEWTQKGLDRFDPCDPINHASALTDGAVARPSFHSKFVILTEVQVDLLESASHLAFSRFRLRTSLEVNEDERRKK
jgi:hypothetical protein